MRPADIDPRYTRKNRRDREDVAERYRQSRRGTRRGTRVRQAQRDAEMAETVIQMTTVAV